MFDPSMGLERVDHCVAKANPALWIWPSGSYMKWLKVFFPTLPKIQILLSCVMLGWVFSAAVCSTGFQADSHSFGDQVHSKPASDEARRCNAS